MIAGSDDAVNLSIMMQARVLNPRIRIINRFFEERQRAGGSYAEGAVGWGFKPQPIESTV